MSENGGSSSNSRTGLTATVTGLLVSISALFTSDLTTEAKTIIPIIAGILSPFIVAGISRLQRKVEQAPELTDYLTAYENDLKYQNKVLKDKTLTPDDKKTLEKRRSETILKLATAHQDFRSETLGITTKTVAVPEE